MNTSKQMGHLKSSSYNCVAFNSLIRSEFAFCCSRNCLRSVFTDVSSVLICFTRLFISAVSLLKSLEKNKPNC